MSNEKGYRGTLCIFYNLPGLCISLPGNTAEQASPKAYGFFKATASKFTNLKD